MAYDYEDELPGELRGEELEEEEEEPDRLSILLLDSTFTCYQMKNGYYADEELDCEVFHYCQDNVKHSWLCPEGASFHQVSGSMGLSGRCGIMGMCECVSGSLVGVGGCEQV